MTSPLKRPAALAFLAAVFLNAFVDLGHKIVIQNTIFKMYDGQEQLILTAIVNGLILLPFILLFSPAGFASDRYPKHTVMRAAAWAALGLTSGITLCYAFGWFWAAFAMTFLLAAQSAFYSPAKFGYIRGFFGKEHLASANGIVAAVSIIAILAGTLVYSMFFERLFPEGATQKSDIVKTLVPIGGLLIVNALIELVMTYRLPNVDAKETDADTPANSNITTDLNTPIDLNTSGAFSWSTYLRGGLIKDNLAPVLKHDAIRLSIIGLAMFWSVGQVMLAAFPAFAKAQTGETNTIAIQLVLAASGLGIAIGSIIASRVSKRHIETGLIPVGAVGIAAGLFILPSLEHLIFMGMTFLFIGIMGGFFIVPLNALIQYNAHEKDMGKVLAGNNLIQNISMLTFLLITVGFALAGLSSQQLLICTALFALGAGTYTVYKLPQSLVRFILASLVSRRYSIDVQGMKHIPNKGGILLLGNHISWIDWAIIQIACPRAVQFVMLKSIYERWYLNWFFKLFGCVPIEGGRGSKASLETVASLLDDGKVVCLFPEGAISHTGQLGDFKRGFERIADITEAPYTIIPFYLRGLWGSQWSRSSEQFKKQNNDSWKRDIVVAFGAQEPSSMDAVRIKQRVFDLSIDSWQHYVETLPTLAQAWIHTCKQRGSELSIADSNSQPLTSTKALAASMCFAKKIKRISPEQNIGLLLPTSAGGVLANMAVLLLGKTLVNLNYSASTDAISSAIEQSHIKTVYTSERFIKKLTARGVNIEDAFGDVNVIYLESLKEEISKAAILRAMVYIKILPTFLLKRLICKKQNPNNTAAILFSSGSEGAPKGIELSHKNIMANLKQIASVLNMQKQDAVMASLPLFHAFGLTVTQFMPLVEGLPMICHPDPTDALGISKAVAKYQATIMCGTSTFLRLYCRNSKIHPLMLDSLRLVISGAEKLKPDVRDAFQTKFNKIILEGYGATETTPVASVNMPDALDMNAWKVQRGSKPGSVGLPLPGTSFKIVDPESHAELPVGEDGMILIGGAQVMKGYLNAPEKTQSVIIEKDGTRWYITGDKGHIDEAGFLSIVDRYSRFAKIGGEMISLTSVEYAITQSFKEQYPELDLVAVNIPDEKKGEKIVILSDTDISLDDIKSAMREHNCNALMFPTAVFYVETLPKLGSGKTDFSEAKQLASTLSE